MNRKRILLLVIVICMILAGKSTVFSQERKPALPDKEMLKEYKDDYREEIRKVLEKHLLSDSGVSVTHVIQENGSIEVTVQIHHKRIEKMNASKRQNLQRELKQIPFEEKSVHIVHEFL